jgi:hypothetical protein
MKENITEKLKLKESFKNCTGHYGINFTREESTSINNCNKIAARVAARTAARTAAIVAAVTAKICNKCCSKCYSNS